MSTIERTINSLDERESVTTISANARIDYILRFSKQAVLVIDDDPEIYTNVGNEFLGSLSAEHNAAFVSISSKLNDIQIRCRIIEQLFGNTLFDPEQPLSVNVVKLAEAKDESISIVIAHVEFLSLQLTHELCQLAEIAKKLNKTINVLLLGKTQAAKNLSENKHLFENKISILLAASGQLISFNSSHLKDNSSLSRNFIIGLLLLLVISIFGFIFVYEYFNKDTENEIITTSENQPLVKDEYKKAFVKATPNTAEETLTNKTLTEPEIASSQEIFNFLIATESNIVSELESNTQASVNQVDAPLIPSLPAKPVENLSLNSKVKKDNSITESEEKPLKQNSVALNNSLLNDILLANESYYQKFIEGYVIQLASFAKEAGFRTFLKTHSDITLYGYARRLNGTLSYIVTTQVYDTNSDAKTVRNELSEELRSRGPWIKSVQAVNNEINLYQQSR